jgi:hypothetical protein
MALQPKRARPLTLAAAASNFAHALERGSRNDAASTLTDLFALNAAFIGPPTGPPNYEPVFVAMIDALSMRSPADPCTTLLALHDTSRSTLVRQDVVVCALARAIHAAATKARVDGVGGGSPPAPSTAATLDALHRLPGLADLPTYLLAPAPAPCVGHLMSPRQVASVFEALPSIGSLAGWDTVRALFLLGAPPPVQEHTSATSANPDVATPRIDDVDEALSPLSGRLPPHPGVLTPDPDLPAAAQALVLHICFVRELVAARRLADAVRFLRRRCESDTLAELCREALAPAPPCSCTARPKTSEGNNQGEQFSQALSASVATFPAASGAGRGLSPASILYNLLAALTAAGLHSATALLIEAAGEPVATTYALQLLREGGGNDARAVGRLIRGVRMDVSGPALAPVRRAMKRSALRGLLRLPARDVVRAHCAADSECWDAVCLIVQVW